MVKIVYRSEIPAKTMKSSHLLNESALAMLDDERFSPKFASRLKDCIYTMAIAQYFPLAESDPKDTLKAKILTEQLMETISRSEHLDRIAPVFFRDGDLEKFRAWLTRECEHRQRRPKAHKLPQSDFKLEVAGSIAQVFLFHGKKLTVTDSDYGTISDFVFAVEVALAALGRKRGDIKRLLFQVQKIIAERGPVAFASQGIFDDDIL